MATKKTGAKKLKQGHYTNVRIKSIKQIGNDGQFSFTFDFSEAKRVKLIEKVTEPDAGVSCFFVACHKLGVYTSIGADNIHHASNKATKLFGAKWSFIRPYENPSDLRGYQVLSVAKFSELLRELEN